MWLTHWIENVAPLAVNDNAMVGYRVAVRKHLIPGLGAHRLDRLEPERIEAFCAREDAGQWQQARDCSPGAPNLPHRPQ